MQQRSKVEGHKRQVVRQRLKVINDKWSGTKRWSHTPVNWPMHSQCPHVNEYIAFPSVVIWYLPGTQHWHVLSGWPDICTDTGWEMESLYYQLLKWLVFSGAERNWIRGIQTHNLIAISAALCGGLSRIPIDSLSPSLQVGLDLHIMLLYAARVPLLCCGPT